MKTSFKKEFNTFEDDFNIEETTINEDIGIDPQKIRTAVLAQISEGNNKKKKKHKNITFMLIAAALTTAIVGTTAAAVALNKKDDFSEVISGESEVLPIYYNDKMKVETLDDNLEINFLGYKGNKNLVYAALEVSTKDGSSFLGDYDGVLTPNTISENEDIDSLYEFDRSIYDLYPDYVYLPPEDKYTHYDFQNYNAGYPEGLKVDSLGFEGALRVNLENDENDENVYFTKENKKIFYYPNKEGNSIKIIIRIDNSFKEPNLIGSTVEFRSDYLRLFKYGDIIKEYDKLDEDTISEITELSFNTYEKGFKPKYDSNGFNAKITTENGIVLDTRDGTYKVRKIDELNTRILPFKISFKIDNITESKELKIKLDHKTAPNSIPEGQSVTIAFNEFYHETLLGDKRIFDNLGEIKDYLKSFGDMDSVINSIKEDKNAKIILKNGKEYYFKFGNSFVEATLQEDNKYNLKIGNTSIFTDSPDKLIDTAEINYLLCDNYNLPMYIIDPDNIAQIIINGDTVYKAE